MGSREKDQTTSHHPLLSSLVIRPTDSVGGGGATGGGGAGSDYEPGEVRRDPLPYSRSDRYTSDDRGYRMRAGSVSPLRRRDADHRYSPGFGHSGAPPRGRGFGNGRDLGRYRDHSPPYGRGRGGGRFGRVYDRPGYGPGPFRGEGLTRNNPNVRPREGDWVCPDPLKPESPRARSMQNVNEVKDGTPKKQKQCNCKHSRCLKLYCECFASGVYCDGCNCVNCHNNVENEAARSEAVEATLERNPNAFRPKIASSPHGTRDIKEDAGDLILGSEERQALFHGDHANNMVYIQQAANAAITGAIGSSGYGSPPMNKKRKGPELFFGGKDPVHGVGQFQQANQIKASVPSSSQSSLPGARPGTGPALGPSKFTYRSLLADIIQPQDLKELCSVLVVYSGEAAKMLAEERNTAEKQAEDCSECSLPSSTQDNHQSQKDHGIMKPLTDDVSSGNHAKKASPGASVSDEVDVSKRRPMSPSTLALMCDEQDMMFTTTTTANGLVDHSTMSSQLPQGKGLTEAYIEQERIVLTKFRDCLNRLVTLGEIKETKYSLLA